MSSSHLQSPCLDAVPKANPTPTKQKEKQNRSGSPLIVKRETLPHVELSRNIVYFGTAESLENVIIDLDLYD